MTVADYNYARFRSSDFDLANFPGPRVGDLVPDLTLTSLDGPPRSLQDFRGRTVLLETGSATCPMYAKSIPTMNRLADRFTDVDFVVLYVREAHPGERIGPHRSTTDKLSAAGRLGPGMDERRLILLDDLSGTAHRQLGLLPNMVYIVGPDGRVRFRGDWTDPAAVAAVLDGTASASDRERDHFPPARPSPSVAIRTLLSGGVRALLDFAIGLPGLLLQHRRADRRYRRG